MAKKVRPNRDMREGEKAIRKIMTEELSVIADALVKDLMNQYKKLTPAQRINAPKKVKIKSFNNYKNKLLTAVSILALDALEKAQSEAPKTLKLAMPTEFKKLPPDVQRKVKAQVDLTLEDQKSKLEKLIFFQYTDSYDSTDSESTVRDDIEEAATDFIIGNSIRGAATSLASKSINEARSAFFFQKDTLEQIKAFKFVNSDPQAAICKSLAGKVFPKDDPNMFRYTPPLHFNCKSYILPVYANQRLTKKPEKLNPPKSAVDTIQFHEHDGDCC